MAVGNFDAIAGSTFAAFMIGSVGVVPMIRGGMFVVNVSMVVVDMRMIVVGMSMIVVGMIGFFMVRGTVGKAMIGRMFVVAMIMAQQSHGNPRHDQAAIARLRFCCFSCLRVMFRVIIVLTVS